MGANAIEPAQPVPDWSIHDLFFHIRPHLLENHKEERWVKVGNDIRDKFSTGQLSVWGRKIDRKFSGGIGSLVIIDHSYWAAAEFVFLFLQEGRKRDDRHAWGTFQNRGEDYADLHVNKAQALAIWPESVVDPVTPEFTPLADAMRQVHEQFLGTKVAVFARAGTANPDDVLAWYALHVQSKGISIYGKRPPSRIYEEVHSVEFPGLEFKNGLSQIRKRFEDKARYVDCAIKTEDIPRCIEVVRDANERL